MYFILSQHVNFDCKCIVSVPQMEKKMLIDLIMFIWTFDKTKQNTFRIIF